MILDEELYLEHFGKKGMKWGKSGKKNKKPVLSKGQKTASAAISIGAGFMATRFVGAKTARTPLSIVSGVGAGLATKRFVDNFISENGNLKF